MRIGALVGVRVLGTGPALQHMLFLDTICKVAGLGWEGKVGGWVGTWVRVEWG